MDIQTTKINLIHWLTELKDPDILRQLEVIKSGQDWWDEISEEERLAIDEGLAQLDRGEGVSHQEVMARVKEKF